MPLVCVVITDLIGRPQLAENDMLVDEYDQYPNEKTEVVVVSHSGSDEPESEPKPSAADRMSFESSLSPPPFYPRFRGQVPSGYWVDRHR